MAQLTHAALAPIPALICEKQIVLMDERDYMSSSQLAFFRSRLSALQGLLESRARLGAGEIASGCIEADPIDRASAEDEHRTALVNLARDAEQLVDVRSALQRIDSGDYGWCLETGEMIGVARLLACPTAVLCVEAQERREAKNNRYRSC